MRLIPILLFLFISIFNPAFSQNAEIPFDGNKNTIEYKKTGPNTYQWKPVTEKMPSSGVIFGSGQGVSTAEPKVVSQGKLPYSVKHPAVPGPVKVSSKISPTKFGKAAGNILKGAAVAAGAATGGVVPLSMLACTIYCHDLFDLIGDEISHFRKDENGDIEFVSKADDSDFISSDGVRYCTNFDSYCFDSIDQAINNYLRYFSGSPYYDGSYCFGCGAYRSHALVPSSTPGYYSINVVNYRNNYNYTNSILIYVSGNSSCPAGHRIQISTGKCFEPGDEGYSKKSQAEYEAAFGRYASDSSLWASSRAPHLAANLATKYDILDDAAPVVSGPESAPISETVTTEKTRVKTGTNQEVSSDYDGETEPATKTTTKTTTAKNAYNGDTMTTTQTTTTTTNITNNITNITTTETKEEEKDDAPDEDATDTPLPDTPELYKKKYPDGLKGVWDKAKSDLDNSKLVGLSHSLAPNIADGGTCPTWELNLNFLPQSQMGVYRFGEEFCFIWPIMRVILLVSALFMARKIIFGG